MIGDTRCNNPSRWYISTGYGCSWCVCDHHKQPVLNKADVLNPLVRLFENEDPVLGTHVASLENRWRCQWDTALHEDKP